MHGARRRRAGSAGGGAGLGWRRPGVSGAQTAQARSRAVRAWLGREVCGAAAKRCMSGARAAAERRRGSGGGGAVYGRGVQGGSFAGRKRNRSETDVWARGRIK